MDTSLIFLIAVAVIALVVFIYIKRHYKTLKLGSLSLVTGGVKTGKSTLSVCLAIKAHKRAVRKVKIRNFFLRLFGKKDRQEQLPLLYSNIPLNYPYVPLSDKLLLRKERFVYKSVIYCNEASLLADSQLIKDKDLNTLLLLFNKLIGHETKGGTLIYDTQSVSDLHYSIKRSLSDYFYIHHLRKGLFFVCAYVIENRYSEDGSVVTVSQSDVETDLKKVLISKKYWKYFDCYCFSVLTDNLPVADSVIKNPVTLKANHILSFRPEINNLVIETNDQNIINPEVSNEEK